MLSIGAVCAVTNQARIRHALRSRRAARRSSSRRAGRSWAGSANSKADRRRPTSVNRKRWRWRCRTGLSACASASWACSRAFRRRSAMTSVRRAAADRGTGPGLRRGTSSPRWRARYRRARAASCESGAVGALRSGDASARWTTVMARASRSTAEFMTLRIACTPGPAAAPSERHLSQPPRRAGGPLARARSQRGTSVIAPGRAGPPEQERLVWQSSPSFRDKLILVFF